MNTHSYKYTYVYSTPMNNSERLSRFDLKIYEVGHQDHFTIDGDIVSH
jgi:hypothetical protein